MACFIYLFFEIIQGLPSVSVVKTLAFPKQGVGFDPLVGELGPHVVRHGQKIKYNRTNSCTVYVQRKNWKEYLYFYDFEQLDYIRYDLFYFTLFFWIVF